MESTGEGFEKDSTVKQHFATFKQLNGAAKSLALYYHNMEHLTQAHTHVSLNQVARDSQAKNCSQYRHLQVPTHGLGLYYCLGAFNPNTNLFVV